MCESIKASTFKEAVLNKGKWNWNVPISDHWCGLSWDTAHHKQVLPQVKTPSAMLLGSQLSEDAFEPFKVSMAISACWPGDKWVVSEAAALRSG